MKTPIDRFGYPLDPKLRALERELDDLAAMFRGTQEKPDVQAEIVRRYHATMAELFTLGWDLRLDPMSELPSELMPPEYNRRHPPYDPFARTYH